MSEVEWVTEPQRFAALAAEWDALLGDDAQPFDLHCWQMAWWEAFGVDGELAVCTVRDGTELVAGLALRTDGRRWAGFAPGHMPVHRPLARDAAAMEVLSAAVIERAPGFVLEGLPVGDQGVEALSAAAAARSRPFLLEPSYVSPIIEIYGGYEDWRKENKKRWGAPLERLRRKMGRDYEAEFSIVEPPADLEAELTEGFRVEASGWKGEAGTAIVSAPETERFYRLVGKAFAERDELRLSRIVLDGEAVAFDFCLLFDGRLYLLKTGIDERFRKLAPGLVMRLVTIERCFEQGLAAHELLGETSDWKLKFSTAERPHTTLRVFPRGPRGIAARGYRKNLRPTLKRTYRRLRPQKH